MTRMGDAPDGSQPELLKVGELATRANLTVRALHHYEEVGLLIPAGRTPAGHRLYGRGELRRLHQITLLKEMGLSLDEIRDSLDGDARPLEEVLDSQIQQLRERIRAQEELCGELEGLRSRLELGQEDVGLAELAETLGRTIRVEKYYSREQLESLEVRARRLGGGRIEQAQTEWQTLFDDYESALRRGMPPDHPHVLGLARRARELISLFTGGDPGIRASLDDLFRSEDPDRLMAQRGLDMPPGLWSYMQRAAEVLADEE